MNNRTKLLADIHNLHGSMREEVLAAGIQPLQYDYPLRYEGRMTTESLESLYKFLQAFANGPYADVVKVRRLRPKEFWMNLSLLFQQHSLTEQRMLRKEQAKLRKHWYAATIEDTTQTQST